MSRTITRSRRHVSLARVLHRRLFVSCDGRVFAVTGRPDYAKVKRTLARYDRAPTGAAAPSPVDLGIAGCDGELSPDLLHSISHALHRWRKELAAEMQRKPARRRPARALARERQELDRLAARLRSVEQWRAELAGGKDPIGAPFFLGDCSESSLQTAWAEAQGDQRLTRLIAWQARIVYWLSGECAARRYLSAITRLSSAPRGAAWQRPVHSFQQAVLVWQRRAKHEPIRFLLKEIAQHVNRLPSDAVRHGRFSARLRNRSFQEHCDFLLQACARLLVDSQRQRWRLAPAALAALTAADSSAIALPQRCFQGAAERGDFGLLMRTVESLAGEAGQPGYDALLAALDSLPESLQNLGHSELRRLLAKGATLTDAAWACEQNLQQAFAESCLSIRAARQLSETFARRGCPLGDHGLSMLIRRLARPEDLHHVQIWLSWLGSVSPRTITPRLKETLNAVFWNRYLPGVARPGWFERLRPSLAAARRVRDPKNCQPLLERIAELQRLAGKTQALPKSLRKLIDAGERRQREREALRTRRAADLLEQAAQPRLEYLERDAAASTNAAKILRVAEETFLRLGIESLRVVSQRLAEDVCRTRLGSLFCAASPDEYWSFACWIEAMSDPERTCLQELIAAQDRYGRGYRRRLAANKPWINDALARNIDLDRWFAAEPHAVEMGGRTVEIELAGELQHLLRMGAYFKTCLSFGGCNEMSVLANAYDANKQVAFMFADDRAGRRQVVARQLIAVSGDFKLVGYHCYVNRHGLETPAHQEIVDAMAIYCARLAAECGLELADQGTPQSIGDHFWYDDGECDWPVAARTAWEECARAALAAGASNDSSALSC